MPKCDLCNGSELVYEATMYGGFAMKHNSKLKPYFYKTKANICHVCADLVYSYWDGMQSAARNLKKRGFEIEDAERSEVARNYTYDIPKGKLEDSFRKFLKITGGLS